MNVLGIDVGTSSVKSAVVTLPTLTPLFVASCDCESRVTSPIAAEISADRLWQTIVKSVRQAVADRAESVTGIGLSVQSPVLCLLDRSDLPLGPFWTHMDRRSRPQARKVWQEVGDEFLREVGARPLPGGISATSWMRRRDDDPALINSVKRYLHLNGWLALLLTGEAGFDSGNASFSGLFGTLTNQRWSTRWCDYFGVDPTWLPSIVDGAATIGQLRPHAANELGLPPNIPVKIGAADTSCGMLGAGLRVGELYHSVGTTQVLATLTDYPIPMAARLTRCFGVGNTFLHVTHNPVGGVALEWMRQLCFSDISAEQYYSETVPDAMKLPTCVQLDPPFLGGDRLEIEESHAAFRNLGLNVDRMDLLACVMQTMRECHRGAVAALGVERPFSRIVISGGGSNWLRQLIPEYDSVNVEDFADGAIRGAASLFLQAA